MRRIDSPSRDTMADGTVPPDDAFAHAATPEQAAALYDEQARKAAALEAALAGGHGLAGNFAALPAMSVRSLDHITHAGDWKLARARIKVAESSED